ncbi:MAG TPA: cobyrinate a,c-diamide synthase [Nitrososphaeraceae archaeon]|nr:cobyrinate a,c-diamide synthase [Nitrososphaeraceae archaeon]
MALNITSTFAEARWEIDDQRKHFNRPLYGCYLSRRAATTENEVNRYLLQKPVFVIAGTTSGVGKTTISMGIMHKLAQYGFIVQPFKIGPDFIDPCYHTFVTGRQSRNLDLWLMGKKGVLECIDRSSKDADLSVIEGVMGLFDGISGKRNFGSTAHISRILDASIILVVDAAKTSQSIAAMILGYTKFDPRLNVAGIIINNVGSQRHSNMILESLSIHVQKKLLGIIYRNEEIRSAERYLGLIPPIEIKGKARNVILNCARYIADQIDLDGMLPLKNPKENQKKSLRLINNERAPLCKIAVAFDESFNFYYDDNLSSLRKNGVSLVFFSPVKDRSVPNDVDGLLIGGGFPEILAKRLEMNNSMKKSIHKSIANEMPTLAECGGLMYLTKVINDNRRKKGGKYSMVGIFDSETSMTNRVTIGYTEAQSSGELMGRISHIHGHEFHYSELVNISSDSKFSFDMQRGRGINGKNDGLTHNSCVASYMHLHFADTRILGRILDRCVHYRRR